MLPFDDIASTTIDAYVTSGKLVDKSRCRL